MPAYRLSVTVDCGPQTAQELVEKMCELLADYGYGWFEASGTPLTEDEVRTGDIDQHGDLTSAYDELCPRCTTPLAQDPFRCSLCHWEPDGE